MDGIHNEIMPPQSVDCNIYKMTEEHRREAGIDALPGSLLEAVRAFEEDAFIKGVLGEDLSEKLIKAKTEEYRDYRGQVTEWEIEKYLHRI